jgi:hypothetical protein
VKNLELKALLELISAQEIITVLQECDFRERTGCENMNQPKLNQERNLH